MKKSCFSPLSHYLEKVQDTLITAWTIRHPIHNRNDPITRAKLYQLIPNGIGYKATLPLFPISTHFTAPPEIPFAPTLLQLGSFHHLSRDEPWDLTANLKSHQQTFYAQSFWITLVSSVLLRLMAQ
ncbi:hypothetical protein Lal_00038133, partial [Lupinus albus]